ncbi:hypothetical protein H8959_015243, partial [Pygathrix nigripes]
TGGRAQAFDQLLGYCPTVAPNRSELPCSVVNVEDIEDQFPSPGKCLQNTSRGSCRPKKWKRNERHHVISIQLRLTSNE